jgi:RNA polymerase sigma factor (sigma-70 family)
MTLVSSPSVGRRFGGSVTSTTQMSDPSRENVTDRRAACPPAGGVESEAAPFPVGRSGDMASSLRRIGVVRRGSATRARDEAAGRRVGALFSEYAPMVLAVCRCQLRDSQAAEDAAQETFLSAHRSLLGGTQPRDPAAWLATIARNECRRTRSATRVAPLDDDPADATSDPADIVADRADLSDVAGAIADLPSRQREALVLREFCGLSYEQIADAMSVSEAAVDSLVSRARRRVIDRIGEIPRSAGSVLAVPASLRDELARLIPGLEAGSAGVGAGAGAATLASVGSSPVAAKLAATCAAAVAVGLPVQATVRERPHAHGHAAPPAAVVVAASARPAHVPRTTRAARSTVPRSRPTAEDTSGPGSGVEDGHHSGSSGPGPGTLEPGVEPARHGSGDGGSEASQSGSSGSGSSGSGSSGSTSSSRGPGGGVAASSGPETSGSGSSSSGSSGPNGPGPSEPVDSGSSGSGSGSDSGSSSGSGSGTDSSGPGTSGSDSGSSGHG